MLEFPVAVFLRALDLFIDSFNASVLLPLCDFEIGDFFLVF